MGRKFCPCCCRSSRSYDEKIKAALKNPIRVVLSKNNRNVCLFYSIEIKTSENETIYFCVVVAVTQVGIGKLVTAYEADFIKSGKVLYVKGN